MIPPNLFWRVPRPGKAGDAGLRRRPACVRRRGTSADSFSLVEVVIALSIISFSLILVVALLGVGISNNHDSSSRLQASNIASLLISTRRSVPTYMSNLANFALPPIGTNIEGYYQVVPGTNYTKVLTDGSAPASGSDPGTNVIYNLRYAVSPVSTVTNVANVDLVLWWPGALAAEAQTMPTNNPANYYEITTQIALP